MIRTATALLSLALTSLAISVARPAAPPLKALVSLEGQLSVIDVFRGEYELGGRGKDSFVASLDLSETWRWEGNLRHLAVFDRLQCLDLSSLPLKDKDIDHVARVRTLRSLKMEECNFITGEAYRKVASLPLLEDLTMTGSRMSWGGSAHLGRLRRLRRLHCNGLDDAGLQAVAGCPRLESLDFKYGCKLTEAGARAFASMGRLRRLALGFTKMPPAAQVHLGRLTALRSIDVDSCYIEDAGFEALTSLPALEHLQFTVYDDGRPSAKALATVSRLKTLRSVRAGANDAFLAALSRCPALEEFDAAQSQTITDAGVAHLARCPRMRRLVLFYTGVTDACVPDLLRMKALREVNLVSTGVTRAAVKRLREARPGLEVTTDFDTEDRVPPQ